MIAITMHDKLYSFWNKYLQLYLQTQLVVRGTYRSTLTDRTSWLLDLSSLTFHNGTFASSLQVFKSPLMTHLFTSSFVWFLLYSASGVAFAKTDTIIVFHRKLVFHQMNQIDDDPILIWLSEQWSVQALYWVFTPLRAIHSYLEKQYFFIICIPKRLFLVIRVPMTCRLSR